MTEPALRRGVRALCLLCVASLPGCAPHVVARPRPAAPLLETAAAPVATPPVTQRDLTAAQQAVRAHPRDSQAYVRLGEVCLTLGQVAEGATALRQAAQLAPQSQAPFMALARLYQETGYLDHECDVLRHLVALRSRDPGVYLELGNIYMRLDWLTQAQPLLAEALKLAPDKADEPLEMGRYLLLHGDTLQAAHLLEAEHRRFPADPAVTDLLAQCYFAMNVYPQAEAVARETLRLRPNDPNVQLPLAYSLMKENRPEALPEAITRLQNVIQSGQRLSEAYTWLGHIYQTQGRTEAAVAAYENALRLEPSFENLALALGQLYLRQGRNQEGERLIRFYQMVNHNFVAFSAAQAVVKHAPDDPNAHLQVGIWYVRLQKYPEAIMEFKRALELRPNDTAARRQLMTALQASGQRSEAKALLASAATPSRQRAKASANQPDLASGREGGMP